MGFVVARKLARDGGTCGADTCRQSGFQGITLPGSICISLRGSLFWSSLLFGRVGGIPGTCGERGLQRVALPRGVRIGAGLGLCVVFLRCFDNICFGLGIRDVVCGKRILFHHRLTDRLIRGEHGLFGRKGRAFGRVKMNDLSFLGGRIRDRLVNVLGLASDIF